MVSVLPTLLEFSCCHVESVQRQAAITCVQLAELRPVYVTLSPLRLAGTPVNEPYHDDVRVPVVVEFTW